MAAQLAHGQLELLGMLRDVVRPDLLEVEAGGQLGAVVAIRALAIDERPLLGRAIGHRRCAERVARGEHARSRNRAREAQRHGQSFRRSNPFHV
jgi:hypothetical protein